MNLYIDNINKTITAIIYNKSKIKYNSTIKINKNELNFNFIDNNKNNISISYSIEELQLTNELFSLYNNIQEIFDVLKDIISNSYNNKKPPIIDDINNNLIFFVELGKIKTITISLKEKINVFIKPNEKIYEEIEEDISKLDSINKIIESYENEINKLKNENSKLNNDIINLQKKLSQNLNKNKDNNNKNQKQKHNQPQKEHKTNSKNNT